MERVCYSCKSSRNLLSDSAHECELGYYMCVCVCMCVCVYECMSDGNNMHVCYGEGN